MYRNSYAPQQIENWNAGIRPAQKTAEPSAYELHLPAKIEVLTQLQSLCDDGTITKNPYHPSFHGNVGEVQAIARCLYDDENSVSLEMKWLTPQQAARVLAALRES